MQYELEKSLDEFIEDHKNQPIETHRYPWTQDISSMDPTLTKTHKWINLLFNFYESSIGEDENGFTNGGYKFGKNGMAKIPGPNFNDNITATKFELTRADITESNTFKREETMKLIANNLNCFGLYEAGQQQCWVVFKKIPIRGKVKATWNTGDTTNGKFESEHWFWTYDVTDFSR